MREMRKNCAARGDGSPTDWVPSSQRIATQGNGSPFNVQRAANQGETLLVQHKMQRQGVLCDMLAGIS